MPGIHGVNVVMKNSNGRQRVDVRIIKEQRDENQWQKQLKTYGTSSYHSQEAAGSAPGEDKDTSNGGKCWLQVRQSDGT